MTDTSYLSKLKDREISCELAHIFRTALANPQCTPTSPIFPGVATRTTHLIKERKRRISLGLWKLPLPPKHPKDRTRHSYKSP